MTNAVMQYDVAENAARNALVEARTLSEVKDFGDKVEAMAHYARRAKDREMEIWLAEMRVRYWRKLGGLTKEIEKGPANQYGPAFTDVGKSRKGDILRAAKIQPQDATRAEKIAGLAWTIFEAFIKKCKADKKAITVDELVAKATQADARTTAKKKLDELERREGNDPTGIYDVIIIDPPWPMTKIERGVRPNQVAFPYPTMEEEQLAALEMPCADDCHVWLWTTHRFMPVAFRLLDAWKLKYVCAFVWHKLGGFQPFGLPQYNCEFAIYARRGSPTFFDTKDLPVCFEAPRGRHSEKPDAFYDMVRRVTAGRRLDWYGRRKIEGFFAAGNEALA